MKKIKTVHIHIDHKFIKNTKSFGDKYFENTQIVFHKPQEIITDQDNTIKTLFFEINNADIKKIINICNKADFVVFYGFKMVYSKIILSLPKKIKVGWRFFGYELYGRRPELFKSELSQKYGIKKLSRENKLKKTIYSGYSYLRYGKRELFSAAIKRIDFMFCLSFEEYQFLKQIWPELPQFIKLPHYLLEFKSDSIDFGEKLKEKKPLIILGNSRNSYNNHLDLIEIVDRYDTKQNYNFTLLFNYGEIGPYTQKVEKMVKDKECFDLIDNFIPNNQFDAFYKKPTALVIDAYRQIAGANIFLALANGTKIYLNNKNVLKDWLGNEGFKIFSIEDFEQDLQDNNLKPDLDVANYNFRNIKKFIQRYTNTDFQKEVYKKLCGDYPS